MIDQIFSGGSYQAVKQMLDMTSQRQEALAGNIANVETPGYQRVDLDRTAVSNFQATMHAAAKSGDFSHASAAHAGSQGVRTTLDPDARSLRSDGNNVEIDHELLAMSQNTVEYGTLTEFASNSLKCLKMAITGREA